MILTDEPGALNPELLDSLVALQATLRQAAHDGAAVHQVEHDAWKRVLALGPQALGYFLALLGDGGQGPTLTLPDGSHVERLPQTHPRRHVSVFGEFALSGAAYGSREGQKIDFAPLDNRLALPEGAFSYLLQDWDQAFVRQRLLRVLRGEVPLVLRGLRQMGTKRRLTAAKRKGLKGICGYPGNNASRMAYDRCLALGYPIASGVIEGACRHLVKGRMERAGTHWTVGGAQAMLGLRSLYVSDSWEPFQAYRIDRETKRLYPHRGLVEGASFVLAA